MFDYLGVGGLVFVAAFFGWLTTRAGPPSTTESHFIARNSPSHSSCSSADGARGFHCR